MTTPKTPAPRWTPAEEARMREMHAAGATLGAIARDLGRSKVTICRKSAAAGLSFDRSRTAAAATARAVDGRVRRQNITSRIYDEIEALLSAVEDGRDGKGWRAILRGEGGVEEPHQLSFVPIRDRRDVADSVTRLTGQAVRLEQVDSSSAEGVRGLLVTIADQLGINDHTA